MSKSLHQGHLQMQQKCGGHSAVSQVKAPNSSRIRTFLLSV